VGELSNGIQPVDDNNNNISTLHLETTTQKNSASNKYLPRLISSLILGTDSNCTNLKHDGLCQ
jgi:hypothetical protein